MKAFHIRYSIAVLICGWASYTFFKGALTGAPPLHSHGWFQRVLHFAAGIIFGAFTVVACLMLAGRW
jgi:hypothetical protein